MRQAHSIRHRGRSTRQFVTGYQRVYYSKRRLLKKDSAPRGRIALPRQQLGAGCSKDGLEQYVPATMGKWPLHSLRLSTFRPATLLPHLSFSAFQRFSIYLLASARASLSLSISRPLASIRGSISSSNGPLGQRSLPKRSRFFILFPNDY